MPAAIACFALGMVLFASTTSASVSYQQNFVNIASGGSGSHLSAAYIVNANDSLATHAFFYQQQNGPCVPTPSGLYAFFLGGNLSNYFYTQNCDGVWVGDGQYHWTMYDFIGNSPCGQFRPACGSFSYGDWAAFNYYLSSWGGGAYLDPNGNINPAMILQDDTMVPPDARGLPITVSHSETLILQDNSTIWSGGAGYFPAFSPQTLSPATTVYQAASSFELGKIRIGSNVDSSLNNHDGVGNVRAWVFDQSGNTIASSTNTCYAEGGCSGAELIFSPGIIAPQNFVLSFITDDGAQGNSGFTLSNISIFKEDPHPTISILSQFAADGVTLIPSGGTANGGTVILKGTLQSSSTDPLVFQVEVEPFGTAFINIATASSSAALPGQLASATVPGLAVGQYHWQARVYDTVNDIASSWQAFGTANTADFATASGPVAPPVVVLSSTVAVFSNAVLQQLISVTNSGGGTLQFTSPPTIGGPNAADFQIASGATCVNGASVNPGSSCVITVTFVRSTQGPEFATLTVYDNAGDSPQLVSLRGLALPPSIVGVSPQSIVQGQNIAAFSVSGANFQSSSILSFSNPGITVTSYFQRTSNQITATISSSSTARPGRADVIVTNLDGQASTLIGAVTVIGVSPSAQGSLGAQGQSGTQLQQTSSEPVATGSGNYYFQHTDLIVPGRGKPLLFQRTYNTLDSYAGPLGLNWTHSYNIFLTVSQVGTVVIKWADGHYETFTWNGSMYLAQPGVYSTLIQNADSSFTLTMKDQTRYSFSGAGVLLGIADKNGNSTQLAYDASGRLVTITGAGSRSLALSYDSSNRIVKITDPAGRFLAFAYDAQNHLVQATDQAGGATGFTYDSANLLLSVTLPNGNTLLRNVYDSKGRVTSQSNAANNTWIFAYDTPNPGDSTITDGRGNQTIHSYDSSLRIIKATDALGGTTSFAYDANNDRTSVTNQNGKTTAFSYDSVGNILTVTDPLGGMTSFSYDPNNNLLSAINPKGKTTTFSYDSHSNLITITDALGNTTTFAYNGFGQLTSQTNARGNVSAYGYDSQGDLTQVTDPLGNITTLVYNGIGRLTSIRDPNGHAATAVYDALNRLVKIADPLGNQTRFAYDAVGNLLKITDANGHATSYAYDATNNLVSVTDAIGHITRYAYDPDNNRAAYTNAKGNATTYAYDALNRLIQITDPLSFVTSYAYDSVGNVLTTTDAKGQTNQFAYDALNRLVSVSYADGRNVAYSFDPNGNRVSMVDSHGTTNYAYDALDRLTSVTHPGGKVVTYGYDAVGNRESLSYPDGKLLAYAYDPANRLSQATDWLGRTTKYSYDAAGNLLGTAYPNQAAVGFAYDAANRLTEVRNSFRRDEDEERGHDGSNALIRFQYLLDAVGNRLQVTDSRGQVKRYSYDPLYELTSVATLDDGHERDDDRETVNYSYDAVGNRITLARGDRATNYTYDADNRLLSAGPSTFAYDPNGNQTSVTRLRDNKVLVYAYDAANRLVAVTGGPVNSTFAYDGDGNRVSQSTKEGTFAYLNDVATALPVVLQESGTDGNISYAYGLGRISGSSDKDDFFYHYDGLGSVVALSAQNGRPSAGYFYDAWGKSVLTIAGEFGRRNKFRFTGEALDPGTELYFLRARYYDAVTGRFITPDPAPGFLCVPGSLNRFEYVLGNPVRFADPSGLSAIEAQAAGQEGPTNASYLASLGLPNNPMASLLAGPIFQLSSLVPPPGPAFQKAAGEFLLNEGLGSFFSLAKSTLEASYNLASQPVSGLELLQQGASLTESWVSFLTNRTVGLVLGGINLLAVPEVAQAPAVKP